MRLDKLPQSNRIEDRRGGRSGGFPGGRSGGIGVGTVVVLGLVGWAFGIDPRLLIQGADMLAKTGQSRQESTTKPGTPSDATGRFVSAILGSTEAEWTDIFAQSGKKYQPPTLVMFSGSTRSGCGAAQSSMGPFYCPLDQKIYLDTSFFQDLERRFRACDIGSKTCQFSQAYVIAHEIGHHVQNLLGLLPEVQQAQRGMGKAEANSLQVRVELQADCFAGSGRTARIPNGHSSKLGTSKRHSRRLRRSAMIDCRNRVRASCPRRLHPRLFGTARRWFMTGLKSGKIPSCDTFVPSSSDTETCPDVTRQPRVASK